MNHLRNLENTPNHTLTFRYLGYRHAAQGEWFNDIDSHSFYFWKWSDNSERKHYIYELVATTF